MKGFHMNDEHTMQKLLFQQKRDEVILLYQLFSWYVSKHALDKNPYNVPETFVLVAAFASVFHDLTVSAGSLGFVVEMNESKRTGKYEFVPHHWLVWQNEDYILDLVPIDGGFATSLPNAVIQNDKRRRFFPKTKVYPNDWGVQKKADFDSKVSDLVEILEILMKKVPL